MLQMAGRMQVLGTETAFEVLARANALAAAGPLDHQSRDRPARFPDPRPHRRGRPQGLADGHHGYTPANGIPPLRAAVAADLYRRHKVEVSPDDVLVVPGGKVTMFFAIMMFGEPGTEILYPNPGFPIYESVIKFSGATPVPVPLYESKGFSFSADEVLAKITPQHPPPDHQQPGQSDRRRRAARGARQARRRPRKAPARRGDERRDLRRDPL